MDQGKQIRDLVARPRALVCDEDPDQLSLAPLDEVGVNVAGAVAGLPGQLCVRNQLHQALFVQRKQTAVVGNHLLDYSQAKRLLHMDVLAHSRHEKQKSVLDRLTRCGGLAFVFIELAADDVGNL